MEINMKDKTIFVSKRDANKALWGNDSPYRMKVVKSKKVYNRKAKHNKKGRNDPFDVFVTSLS